MKVLRGVKQVGCHFPRRALSRKDSLPNSGGANLARVASGVVGRVGLLVVGLVDGDLLAVVLEEVGAGGAFGGQLGLASPVEAGLDVEEEGVDALG